MRTASYRAILIKVIAIEYRHDLTAEQTEQAYTILNSIYNARS